jgi:hypothetical protein
MAQKLTEDELSELRGAFAAGATPGELALAYEVTERHVWRLCQGIERRLPRVEGSVAEATERFLEGLRLDAGDEVVASAARLVAARLDKADARTTSALAEKLVDLCQQLALRHRQPDRLDDLIARRQARRLRLQMVRGGTGG